MEIKCEEGKEDVRYYDIPSNKSIKMFTGGTGCGKTYKMINEYDNFILAVPTRQLAYEIFLDYKKVDFINTGEVHVQRNDKKINGVIVYENLSKELIDDYSVLLVDECHFLADTQRGGELLNKIIYALSKGKRVVMSTATNTLCEDVMKKLHIKETELKPFVKVEKKEIKDLDEMVIIAGKNSTLVFTKFAPTQRDVEEYCNLLNIPEEKATFISANVPSSKRIERQIAFKKGDLQLMISSNVLAQGVNFPAVCVIIEWNEWDDWEIVSQKIGRAGRPNLSDKAYYYLYDIPEKFKRKTVYRYDTTVIVQYNGCNIEKWNIKPHEIPSDISSYKGFKYSKRFLTLLKKNHMINNEEQDALTFLINEEEKVRDLILPE